MRKLLCSAGALIFCISLTGCAKIEARIAIKEANDLYRKEQYAAALKRYEEARKVDGSFAELDRLIGYSNIGLFQPDNDAPENQKFADRAIQELERYLQKRPDDNTAREALINLFLNANRTSQAIDYFQRYLKANPADLSAVRSIARLYAQEGNFIEAMNWYKKITLLDARNPEAYYTYGVVLYEKVSKNPSEDMDETQRIIEEGKQALQRAIDLRTDYFDALVYMNLMYREQAKLEPDVDRQQELYQTADKFRNRAIEISRAKKKT